MRPLFIALMLFLPTTALAGNPMISPIPDQWIDMNSSTPVLTVRVSDNETPADQLVLSASTNNPTVISNEDIDLDGSGSNRTVQVTSGDRWGTAVIMITATDADGSIGQEAFNVEVRQPPQ